MKLPTLLRLVRADEYRAFEKFLQSPYFGARAAHLDFFRALRTRGPSYELGKADLQAAFRRSFPGMEPTDSRLYNLTSELGKLIEQFLVVQSLLPTPNDASAGRYELLLTEALGQRNAGAYFVDESEALIARQLGRRIRSADDAYALYRLHYEVYFNPDTPKHASDAGHLKDAARRLDEFYCQATLHLAAEMQAQLRIHERHFETPLLDAVLQYSSVAATAEPHELWDMYRRVVALYRADADEAGYNELIGIFTERFALFPAREQRLLIAYLINYGIVLENRGTSVERQLFALYKLAIEADFLLIGGRMTYSSFINIGNLAGLNGAFDWADHFIAQFAPYLEDSVRQPAVDLVRAGLLYNRGDLDAAHKQLASCMFSIPEFSLPARALLVKIVFDRFMRNDTEYEFLRSSIRALKKYIGRKPLPETRKIAYFNWLRFLWKIARARFERIQLTDRRHAALQHRIRSIEPMMYKKWLERAVNALADAG